MARRIRASEIGSYLFCQKAWKYQRQGLKSENQIEMLSGTRLHDEHGQKVIAKGFSQTLAIFFLIAAAFAVMMYFLSEAI